MVIVRASVNVGGNAASCSVGYESETGESLRGRFLDSIASRKLPFGV